MSECVCGGTKERPNTDCERCQLLATIATLTAELERLKSDYAELAGIAERMLTLVKVDPLKEHCECLACSVQREYATHQAKGKP